MPGTTCPKCGAVGGMTAFCGTCGSPLAAPLLSPGAARAPILPSLALTIVITALFGVFGVIPAAVHAGQANAVGQSGARYWKAFGWTFAISVTASVLGTVLIYGAFFAALLGISSAANAPGYSTTYRTTQAVATRAAAPTTAATAYRTTTAYASQYTSAALTEADAAQLLSSQVAQDRTAASGLAGAWTAQIASSGPSDSSRQILAKYQELKSLYPRAVVVWSGDWPGSFGPSSRQSYVVLSGDRYTTTRPVLAWCTAQGRSDSNCWAKRLAVSGDDPNLNTDHEPADDRNN